MLYGDEPFGAAESLLTHEVYSPGPLGCPRIGSPASFRARARARLRPGPHAEGTRRKVIGEVPGPTVQLPDVGRTIAVNFADTEQPAPGDPAGARVPPQSVRVTAAP